MARNKYPEETIEKILKVTAELFMEKGYDNTSMQDIVNRLGMSKGAIYHHFKSKEDLLDKISLYFFADTQWFSDIVSNSSLNGLNKLREVFFHEIQNEAKIRMDTLARPLLQDPRLFVEQFRCTMSQIAPMITKVIEEGVADGSINTAYPKETSELLLVAINIWVNPGIMPCSKEDFMRKITFMKGILDTLGLPLIDDEFLKMSDRYYEKSIDLN